jgi:peptide-methionine (S)-S-oxide reductase
MHRLALALGLLAIAAFVACGDPSPSVEPVLMPPSPPSSTAQLATFGGGCFWCTEAIFRRLEGVTSVVSGYAGGAVKDPTYEQVSGGDTGHAEVIQVAYDPAKVTYEQLLEVFFKTHDPTTLNAQGADHGTQYRSIILVHDAAQRAAATSVMAAIEAAKVYPRPLVTEIVPYTGFYRAEDYHQGFYDGNPRYGYCQVVIAPKLEKLDKLFRDRLRKK